MASSNQSHADAPIFDSCENSMSIEDVKDFPISTAEKQDEKPSFEMSYCYQDFIVKEEYVQQSTAPDFQQNRCIHCLQPVGENTASYAISSKETSKTDFEATVISELQAIKSKLEKIENDIAEIRRREQTTIPADEAANSSRQLVPEDIELEALFPVASVAALSDLEVRLHDANFAKRIDSYLRRTYRTAKDIDSIFRSMVTDEVYIEFNLDGRLGKRSLYSLKLFKNILFDACNLGLGRDKYEEEIRRTIHKAHNRYHKRVSKIQKQLKHRNTVKLK